MLEIIYEDEWYVAINKPHGLLAHRTKIAEEKKEFAMQMLRDQLNQHVFLIHRIDRPTSGVLLFAKDSISAQKLALLFEQRQVKKEYFSIVRGYTDDSKLITHPLKKDEVGEEQEAITYYETLGKIEIPITVCRYPTSRYSLLKVRPETGRMHQIRRHLAKERHYIIGDKRHGDCKHNKMFEEQFQLHKMLLHAAKIEFTHPYTQKNIIIEANTSPEFDEICRRFNWIHLIK